MYSETHEKSLVFFSATHPMSLITTNSWRYLWHESSTRNHSIFYYLNQAHGRRNMSHSPFIKHINAILSFTQPFL
jgi:hypothetical protein